MADYIVMDQMSLRAEHAALVAEYEQFYNMGLKLDMSRGKPSPEQLDLSMGLLGIVEAKDDTGADARNYGHLEGLPEARRYFAEWMGVAPEQTIVGGNASLTMMYNMLDLGCNFGFPDGQPWRNTPKPRFLCPAPGYDRHFRLSEVFGFELVTVPMTPAGPDMVAVEALVRDPAVKGIWCVPVYSNPDGYVYSQDTVERLAAMQTAAPDFRIFWDNAYGLHHLTDAPQTCPNILQACRAAGHENRPLIFMSTSKITFAGSGVCCMGAGAANIQAALKYYFPMLITFDKENQLRHVRFLQAEGGVAAHMKKHAAILAPKFAAVQEELHRQLDSCGAIARWTDPKGGYFVSLYTMDGCAGRVVELCKQAGVVLTGAGAAYPYGVDPADAHIRIAPSYPPIEELKTAARLLCLCTRLASCEKLLGMLA